MRGGRLERSESITEDVAMDERALLARITVSASIFGGKPVIRGQRLAVEHVLGMLAAGDSTETILEGYPWLEIEDIQACLLYARRLVGHERVEPLVVGPEA
jgi:uncharacterized protein (DUF433 family)